VKKVALVQKLSKLRNDAKNRILSFGEGITEAKATNMKMP
jgi:hypothetical protein